MRQYHANACTDIRYVVAMGIFHAAVIDSSLFGFTRIDHVGHDYSYLMTTVISYITIYQSAQL